MNDTFTELGRKDPTGTHTLQVISKASRFNEWMYNSIRPYLKGEVLEIGSGIGNISSFLVRDNFSLSVSDYNPEYQDFLSSKFGGNPAIKDILSIDLQHPDFINKYGHLKEKFESIFLLNVIEHLKDDKFAINNCYYMLKKNGNLVLLAPAYRFLYCNFDKRLGHYRRYTRKSLKAILPNSSFKILHNKHFNAAGIIGWFLFGKILGKDMIGAGEMSTFDKLVPLFKLADKILFNQTGLSVIIAARKL